MAVEEKQSLSPANLSAARQHVRTLSTREREALLRVLLEQYDKPQDVAEATTAQFDCLSLLDEAEEDGMLATALAPPPQASSSSSSSTPWPMRSASATAKATQHSPKQPRFRSHSISHTSLQSSFSINRHTVDSADLSHHRAKSYSVSAERGPKAQGTTAATAAADAPPASNTAFHGGLNIIIPANASFLQGAATVENRPPPSYQCTSCRDKFGERLSWAQHDVACRSVRRLRPQRAWACGFCAAFLGSLERYQDHVAGHFDRGRTLADWHYANVIYGLLHQPVVHKEWKRIWAARAAAVPADHRPKATWPSGCRFATTRRMYADAKPTGRTSSDTRDTHDSSSSSSSPDSDIDGMIYVSLKEALESFDPATESASVVVLQAESLAIFISVPIEEGSGRGRGERSRDRAGRSSRDKDARRLRSRSKGQPESAAAAEAPAKPVTATAAAGPMAPTAAATPPRTAPAPAPTAKIATPKPAAATVAPAPSPPTSTPPAREPASVSVSVSVSASAAAPAAPALLAGRSKDDPLPALPLFATQPPAASAAASPAPGTAKKEPKPRRTSASRVAVLKPLNIFRSRSPESAKDATAAKKTATSPKSKLFKLSLARGPAASDAGPSRSAPWADRPLPPLVGGGQAPAPAPAPALAPAASLSPPSPPPSTSTSTSPSPSSSPETKATLVPADHYSLSMPHASSRKAALVSGSAESSANAFVDAFMASLQPHKAGI